jgi:anti-anti-sigma factor
MIISEIKKGNIYVFNIDGRLDSNTSVQFEEKVCNAIEAGESNLLVDFSQMDYISSAGLRVILMAAKKTRTVGGKVVLTSLNENVKEVFDIAGFSSIFAIYPSQEEALKVI